MAQTIEEVKGTYVPDPRSGVSKEYVKEKIYKTDGKVTRVEKFRPIDTERAYRTDRVRIREDVFIDYSNGQVSARKTWQYGEGGRVIGIDRRNFETGKVIKTTPDYTLKDSGKPTLRDEAVPEGKPGTIVTDVSGKVIKADPQFQQYVGRILTPSQRQALSAGAVRPDAFVEKGTTRQEFATALFEKQGKDVRQVDGGLEFVEDGRKTTYTLYGDLVETPASAEVSPGQVRRQAEQIREKEVAISRVEEVPSRAEVFFGPDAAPKKVEEVPKPEIRPDVPLDFVGRMREAAAQYEFKARQEGGFRKYVSAAKALGASAAAGFTSPVLRPKEFLKGTVKTITSPVATLGGLGKAFKEKPGQTIGEVGGQIALFKTSAAAANIAKSAYIKVGTKYVPPEQVFSPQVLKEGKTLPTTKGISESLRKFGETDVVVTAAPSKVKGPKVEVGKKAALGLEDPGIYVTPKGEASPYFLRIKGALPMETKYSFNILQPVKEFFGVPGVTEFKVKGVTRLPRKVIKQPGFETVGKYFEQTAAKTGKAYITKRSEIGLGEVARQKYKSPTGKTVVEMGTSELEAVIPLGAEFTYAKQPSFLARVKGFGAYTEFGGKPVAIRQAVVKGVSPTTGTVKTVSVAPKTVLAEASRAYAPVRYKTPVSVLKYSVPSRVSSAVSTTSFVSGVSSVISPSRAVSKVTARSIVSTPSRVYPVKDIRYTPPPSRAFYPTSRSFTYSTPATSYVFGGDSYLGVGDSYVPPPPTTSVPPPPKLVLKLPKDDKLPKKKKKKSIRLKQLSKYTPTATAAVFKYKGKEPSFGEITGQGVRPIRGDKIVRGTIR